MTTTTPPKKEPRSLITSTTPFVHAPSLYFFLFLPSHQPDFFALYTTTSATMALLAIISVLFGWIYTVCWSASFYPQFLLNLRRKSTSGTTVDFPFLNTIGFAAYLASNVALYYSPTIRAQYAARNNNETPAVRFNDVTFALHALVVSNLTLSQYLAASSWSFTASPGSKPSRSATGIATGCAVGLGATLLTVASSRGTDPATSWCALDIVYALGYVKLIITLVKYTPQLLTNYRNKSTKGWSILQILLDVAGGLLSVGQLLIDSHLQGNWHGVFGNPVKFFLGNISMVFDSMFMVQHYGLYGDKEYDDDSEEERGGLLFDEERGTR
ncbi:hypothetical protein VHEMI01372 [[Torrubiella] hemipterigena]|uniref:Cystinosin n=1 Tax=[Torrubiella] hemipterigena TaxID=1531966 RepID=A0A0A1SSY4_9HYPO|nr:hypothetical protein VHEMI01372 [[Torrubiella] hemipterigena]